MGAKLRAVGGVFSVVKQQFSRSSNSPRNGTMESSPSLLFDRGPPSATTQPQDTFRRSNR